MGTVVAYAFTSSFEQIRVLIFAFINLFYSIFSERALLNRLMIELSKLDCDVLVGHNISGFDLDVLLHRAQVFIIIFLVNFGTSMEPVLVAPCSP